MSEMSGRAEANSTSPVEKGQGVALGMEVFRIKLRS